MPINEEQQLENIWGSVLDDLAEAPTLVKEKLVPTPKKPVEVPQYSGSSFLTWGTASLVHFPMGTKDLGYTGYGEPPVDPQQLKTAQPRSEQQSWEDYLDGLMFRIDEVLEER